MKNGTNEIVAKYIRALFSGPPSATTLPYPHSSQTKVLKGSSAYTKVSQPLHYELLGLDSSLTVLCVAGCSAASLASDH